MLKLVKYDGTKTYMYPNSQLADPDRVKVDYPAILVFPHVVELDENEQVIFAVLNISALRTDKGIDPNLSEAEAISELEYIINNPPAVEFEITPEERIAAALEYNNLLNTPTV